MKAPADKKPARKRRVKKLPAKTPVKKAVIKKPARQSNSLQALRESLRFYRNELSTTKAALVTANRALRKKTIERHHPCFTFEEAKMVLEAVKDHWNLCRPLWRVRLKLEGLIEEWHTEDAAVEAAAAKGSKR
jgi:hypothetical protein